MTDRPLAVVVEESRTGQVIDALGEEGVYDADRRVRAHGEGTTAVPVTAPPASVPVLEVVEQVDPAYRTRTLADVLTARGWDEAAIEAAPSSWAVVGSVVVVRSPADCLDEAELGEALLELHGGADSVIAVEAIEGRRREPATRRLAGSGRTETVHREYGTAYVLDPQRVMFSPGNKAERRRMGEVVSPGERVFDMFAGVGYFALPMARAGATVVAAEVNPTAFGYLVEGAALNGVTDRLEATLGDCRAVAETIEPVDRVVMGYYGTGDPADEPDGFLPAALDTLTAGGTLHYHEATPTGLLPERPLERLEAAATAAGRELSHDGPRRVKGHAAGVDHVVVDATLS